MASMPSTGHISTTDVPRHTTSPSCRVSSVNLYGSSGSATTEWLNINMKPARVISPNISSVLWIVLGLIVYIPPVCVSAEHLKFQLDFDNIWHIGRYRVLLEMTNSKHQCRPMNIWPMNLIILNFWSFNRAKVTTTYSHEVCQDDP